jgi:uncharacterized membrane protein
MITYIIYGIIIFVLLLSAITFYNTIITKKWRNKAINESQSWKWGMFYYNPMDKRIFLPKRSGLGLTLNFANPVATVIMCALFLIIIITLIYPFIKY